MDQIKEDMETVNEIIDEISIGLSDHKQNLKKVLKEVKNPKKDTILSQFHDTMEKWELMVEMQCFIFNNMEQETMLNSIEVIGLPEEYAKNISGVAFILSKLLRIAVHESHIKGFRRIGDLDKLNDEVEGEIARPLVVDLVDQNIKKRILTVVDMVVLSVIGSDRPMYIVEHLTNKNKELLNKARQEALRQEINHVWVKDGKIYARRGEHSFTYEIRCDADIRRMARY